MKCIVETTGSFMFINTDLSEIQHNRPSVTGHSAFIDLRLNNKELKILARNLPHKASDVEFAKALKAAKGKVSLAVSAYCAELGVDTEGEAIEVEIAPKKVADKKAKELADKKAKELADKG